MAFAAASALLVHATPLRGGCASKRSRPRPRPQQQAAVRLRAMAGAAGAVDAAGADAPQVRSGYWQWADKGRVHYRHAGDAGPVVVFVPGFGCGAFQFEESLSAVAARGCRAYAMDKLGLGESTVRGEGAPAGEGGQTVTLQVWLQQLVAFVEHLDAQVAGPIFVAGNSLGGLLTAQLCAARPELLAGAVLLNAAPFWVCVPAATPPPLVAALGKVIDFWWARLTNPRVVRETLGLVYARKDAVKDSLVDAILAPTRRPGARATFRSVLTSPPLDMAFHDAACAAFDGPRATPLALVNGAADPWVGPIWAMRLKNLLPHATLYELQAVGHCPHDEAPDATAYVVSEWVHAIAAGVAPPALGSVAAPASVGECDVVTKYAPTTFLQRFASSGSVLVTLLLAAIESVL